mmetsp:Transcript_59287/g.130138  ORF Transcript_59287/g.130138 Transcript_59287/m.130138 type:complete len:370 (-) Transcript_59287:253-1362(-)
MGGWNSHPEPEPKLEPKPEVKQASSFDDPLDDSPSPEEILRQLFKIEKQCCPASSAACSWPKEPNASLGPDEAEGKGEDGASDGETLSVKVLLDEPDVRFCICYDDDSPVIIACLWARLKGLDFEDVVASLCEERAEWDKGGESRLVERSTREDGSSEEVYHTLIRCPRPFWDREILKRQWRLPLDCQHGQGCALISRSLQDNIGDKDPEKVRAFVHKAGALIRPAQDCASPEASVCSAGTNHEEDLLSLPIANHFCSTGTELTSCSQIDMGGLIPAWATNYLSSFVVGKALSWTEDLRRHCASRKLPSEDADNVPTLAEISKDLMPGWTENWDDTELVVPEDGDGLRKDTSLTSMAWSHFWSSGELSS